MRRPDHTLPGKPRRMTTADLTPAEHEARLDALAEQSVRAAETHGVPSPQHDAAMDAHADYEWEHALQPKARLMSGDAISNTATELAERARPGPRTARTYPRAYAG